MNKDILARNYMFYRNDWNAFASDIFKSKLDRDQQEILSAIQTDRRVSVRSGTSRGKDYVAAVASLCFLYLTPWFDKKTGDLVHNTKVALVAPTGRQIKNIMIPEVSRLFNKARGILPGYPFSDGIRMTDYKEWFLTGFKAGDDNVEAWSGFHAANVMVVITEASGLNQITFDSIEGILQGNSRLVLMFNPNNTTGEAYTSQSSPLYSKFTLNDLNAPNVTNQRLLNMGKITGAEFDERFIPGQVDYEWIDEKIRKPGWVVEVPYSQVMKDSHDFEWEGRWYRPGDLFRVKVLGQFPEESEDTLIPLSWLESANKRWDDYVEKNGMTTQETLRLGVDVAGMGRDNTIFCYRYGNFVSKIETLPPSIKKATVHMAIAGQVVTHLENQMTKAFIDTIGEGAGVYSRIIELGKNNAYSAKSSFGTKGLTDETGVRKFANMRAYMFWKLRDYLNPAFDYQLALPRNDMLTQELTEHTYEVGSNGKIQIEKKDDIKERLGRSPDLADSLALTFFPEEWEYKSGANTDGSNKEEYGLF